jgi:cell division protein FtsZ
VKKTKESGSMAINGEEDLKFLIEEESQLGTKIKVIGVGGGGSNAVARVMQSGVSGVEFYVIDTDRQALGASPVAQQVAIGTKITKGLGAGADPGVGRQAALEDTNRIIEILEGADMVFVAAGLGGGTGTGAAPVVASLAKELNALTVAVVTKPFKFEGSPRMKQAERGLAELAGACDTVISIPNAKLPGLVKKGASFQDAFRIADDILKQAVQGISDIISKPGLINRDFSDIRTIMLGMGYAMMGSATARGEKAAVEAAKATINAPLMDDCGIVGARRVLANMTASSELSLDDFDEAYDLICNATENPDVHINFGFSLDEAMGDEVKITVIATGFQRESLPEIERRSPNFPFATVSELPEPEMPPQMDLMPEPPIVETVFEPAEEAGALDDYDTPAIMRKQRRMIQ